MAELLKNMYNALFFERLCPMLNSALPLFDERKFIYKIFDNEWPALELKQRVRHITKALHCFMPAHFPEAAHRLIQIVHVLRKNKVREQSFEFIFLSDYIEVYGLDHFAEAMNAIEEVTQLVSAEFAIRPFLLRYPDQTTKQMLRWSNHAEASVRRLASEGCRPRLPWGMGIPQLKKDPTPIFPILKKLKADPSEYVRKSVANNLNDITKDHPALVLETVKKWYGTSKETDWIIKHGCRTLLKKGHKDALALHGFNGESKAAVKKFMLSHDKIAIGDNLKFNFNFENKEKKATNFRLEYAIRYITSTGKTSQKIFKITENVFQPNQQIVFTRKQSFKDFTTRKHFKGKHLISILINGKTQAKKEFLIG